MRKQLVCAAISVAALGMGVVASFAGASGSSSARVLAAARNAFGEVDWDRLGPLVQAGTEQASGLTGRWRRVEDPRTGRILETSDFTVFQSAEVWTDQTHWRQDSSGGVHALNSAFARQHAVTQMWLARRGYLRPATLGARVEYLGPQQDANHTVDTVRATPRGGQAVELWFDRATGLLVRSVWIMPTDTTIVRYEDYRRVGPIMIAFKIGTQEGDDSDTDNVSVDTAQIADQPLDDEFVAPRTPADSTVAGGVATVPISFDGDVIVEAMLNGQGPFAFILDTGGHDILTPAAAQMLNLKATGAGVSGGAGAGTLPVQYTRVDRVDIGGVSLRHQSFVVIPLQYNTVERGSQPPLVGILGLELFERFAMRLNYRDRTLTFRPLAGAPQGKGVPIAITFTDDQPLFRARIDGISGDNGLDTGNSGSLVVQGRWARANGLAEKMRQGIQTAGFGSGGMSPNWTVRAQLEVAGVAFPAVVARYSEDAKGAFASRTEAGNIGNDVLANFTLDFDYARNTVWFEPAPGFVPPPFARAGLSVFKQTKDSFTVATVVPGAPAAEAGLASGDEIVAVDGVPASALSGWDLGRLLRRPAGTSETFDFVRAGQKHSAVVTLRELLP